MASLLAAGRKNFPAACGLHARAKPVRLGAASLARLICALWQNNPPSIRGVLAVTIASCTAIDQRGPRSANTHGPLSRLIPNHQVYLPSRRRVKNRTVWPFRSEAKAQRKIAVREPVPEAQTLPSQFMKWQTGYSGFSPFTRRHPRPRLSPCSAHRQAQ